MGILSNLFGNAQRTTTKFELASQVASTIGGFIEANGFKELDQPKSNIVLDSELRVRWQNGNVSRGGEVLAAVKITELLEFDMLRNCFQPDSVSAFREMLTQQKENVSPAMFGHMILAGVDVLANAIVREFEAQSPEFRQLSST